MRILIVEDDPFQIKVITKVLESRYDLVSAASGEEAMSFLEGSAVDLVLLDLALPGIDGIELCRHITSQRRFHRVPILFLTADHNPASVAAGLRAGAQDYIVKGASPLEIRARVESHLTQVRAVSRLMAFKKQLGLAYLVTGICHELLNPLTILTGNLELLGTRFEDEALIELVEECYEECFQISKRVSRLKQYTEGAEAPFEEVDLARVIEQILEILSLAKLNRNRPVRLVVDYDAVPPVLGQKEPIHQAILNVITNAFHAAREGDLIQISMGEHRGFGYIRIRDTGVGIPPRHLNQVFEPFFTTRTDDVGAGLGLPVTRKILETHGGHMDLTSTEGEGTTVTLFLPLARTAVQALA